MGRSRHKGHRNFTDPSELQIAHATDADTNEERDFIIAELQRHDVVANVRTHSPGARLSLGRVNRYVTDGVVAVAEVRLSPG